MARPARRALSVVPCPERLASRRRSWKSRRRATAWAGRWAGGHASAGVQSGRRRPRCTPLWATGPLRGHGGHAATRRRRGAHCRVVAAWEPCQAVSRPGWRHGPAQGCCLCRTAGRTPRTTLLVGKRRRPACRVAAQPAGHTARAWESGARAVASLAHAPSPRATGPVSAASTTRPPQDTAPADSGRDSDRRCRSPGPRLLGPQVAGPLLRVWHGGVPQRRAAAGPPGPLPAQGSAATAGGQGVTRPPHCRRERAVSPASGRASLEGMPHAGRRGKTAPVVLQVLRRMRRACVLDTSPSGQGTPWAISCGHRAGDWRSLSARACRDGAGWSTDARDCPALAHGTQRGVWPRDGPPGPPAGRDDALHRLEASGEPSPWLFGRHATNHKIRWNQDFSYPSPRASDNFTLDFHSVMPLSSHYPPDNLAGQ